MPGIEISCNTCSWLGDYYNDGTLHDVEFHTIKTGHDRFSIYVRSVE